MIAVFNLPSASVVVAGSPCDSDVETMSVRTNTGDGIAHRGGELDGVAPITFDVLVGTTKGTDGGMVGRAGSEAIDRGGIGADSVVVVVRVVWNTGEVVRKLLVLLPVVDT